MAATTNTTTETVLSKLFNPLSPLLADCKNTRSCPSLSDQEWLETGVLRVLSNEPSGRSFLQKRFDAGLNLITRSHFFESLKSLRRLRLCREVNAALLDYRKRYYHRSDPFKSYRLLDDFDIYAGDGHYHKAAAHDPLKQGKKYPVQHFYSINLRSKSLSHLTLADTSGQRKREHDIHALKRLSIDALRQNAKKGRKVLYVWDKAGIDFMQWFKWKHTAGIYFISREKENMRLEVIGHLPVEDIAINKGVQSFEIVGTSQGVAVNRVRYQCPISKKEFSFLTNLTVIPPGLVAYLYNSRWDIEKTFDEVKNKLGEKKAWATSDTAKSMQAQFICIAYNLTLNLESQAKHCGIENKKENTRRKKRLQSNLPKNKQARNRLPAYLRRPKKATQRPLKFIRWLRNNLFVNTSWTCAITRLRTIYAVF